MAGDQPFGSTTTCHACGARLLAAAELCPKCGVRQRGLAPLTEEPPRGYADPSPRGYAPLASPASVLPARGPISEKRIFPTLLFCILLGIFGAHRFYVGRPVTAVMQLLTLGGLGIWWLVDLIMLLTESFKDGEGRRLEEWM